MLRANGALHTVRLHSNAIGDDGAAVVCFLRHLG